MRNHLILLLILLSSTTVSAQFVYKIKADSLLVTNDSCTAEFNLENSTKHVKGFLVNKGNGRTEFRRAERLSDSSFVVAGDTIVIQGTGGGGGGSTPSWHQTLDVNRVTSSSVIFDTTVTSPAAGASVAKNFLTVKAIDITEDDPPFTMNTSANGQSSGTDHVMYMGWNLNPNGTIQTSGKPAIGEAWHQRSRGGGGGSTTNKYEIYGRTNGNLVNLTAHEIDNNSGLLTTYHTANFFGLRATEGTGASNNYYFRIQGNAGNNIGSAMIFSTLAGNITWSNDVIGTSANFSIIANYPGSNNTLAYGNFVAAKLPGSVTLTPEPLANSTSITMADSNSLFNANLASHADRFQIIQKGSGDFVYANANGQKVRFYDTRNYFQNAISVGFDNDPSGAIDARTTTRVNGVHTITSSTTEGYGINATANGSGASFNVGGLFTASNGTSNRGIWITAVNAGGSNNNFNIYAEGTAKSYINGPIGIKNNAPDAYLHLGASANSMVPLKFTAATIVGSPQDGAVEYNGTHYYVTKGSIQYILAKTLTATATLDFGSTAAGGKTDLTISVTNAAVGDVVSVGVPSGSVPANGSYSAWVSSGNTVTVRFTNNDLTTAYDPASGTFRVSVISY